MAQNRRLTLMLITVVTCALVRPYTWTLAYSTSASTITDKELPPQLLPIVLAKFYKEGSNVNLFCSLAEGDRQTPINYEWLKDNQRLRVDSNHNPRLSCEQDLDKSILKVANVQASDSGNYSCLVKNRYGKDSVTVQLRVKVDLKWIRQPSDSYDVGIGKNLIINCEAHGQPSPTIRWSRLSGQGSGSAFHQFNGTGQSVGNILQQQSSGNSNHHFNHDYHESQFKITSANLKDSGIYECVANNGADQELRKVFKINVQVPAKFDEKFTVIQVRSGDSVRLECNATGDLPMIVEWFREGDNRTLDKHGIDGYDIYETTTEHGINSFMIIRSIQRDDGILYKCQAQNDHGKSEKLTKLLIVGVPSKPFNLQAKDVWSRSASLVWSAPFGGNSRITNYTIQYWRKGVTNYHEQQQQDNFLLKSSQSLVDNNGNNNNNNSVALSQSERHDLRLATSSSNVASPFMTSAASLLTVSSLQQQQNHRREELVIDGLQTAALIPNLLPSVTYECSVIAYNQVGKSDASDSVIFTTTEEEPSAPPTDVLIETLGSTTLRVSWKIPPIETWNGRLLGFYVGHRPRYSLIGSQQQQQQQQQHTPMMIDMNKIVDSGSRVMDELIMSSPLNTNLALQQHQQQQQLQPHHAMAQVIYSFKTVDYVKNVLHYDTFLTNLRRGQEYQITVKAFNRAGSGPESHVVHAMTSDGRQLPAAPTFFAHKISSFGVTFRWTYHHLPNNNNHHFTLPHQSSSSSSTTTTTLFAAPIRRHIIYFQLMGDSGWSEVTINRQDETTSNPLNTDGSQAGAAGTSMEAASNGALTSGSISGGAVNIGVASGEGLFRNEYLQSSLLPGCTYRSYIVAVNDFGRGDPSNIVVFKTESNNQLLKEGLNVAHHQSDNSPNQMMSDMTRQQQVLFVFYGAAGLIVIIAVLMGSVACGRRIHRAFHSSSSYPSSWTPTNNTMQSGYSVKRFIDFEDSVIVNGSNASAAAAAANQTHQQHNHLNHNQHSANNSNNNMHNNILNSNLFTDTATLNHPSNRYQQIDQVNQKILQQQIRQSTIARAQQRSLPPIPYSTLTVNDIVMNKPATNKTFGKMDNQQPHQLQQQQHQQLQQQQQQQQQHINHYHTSLIYDVTD